jgi:hypothetical protein
MSIMMSAVVSGGNVKAYGRAFERDSLGEGAMIAEKPGGCKTKKI